MIGDFTLLRDNRFQCINVIPSLEKRLRKGDKFDLFDQQFMEYVTRGVLCEVYEAEINEWKLVGGTVYLHLNP